MKILFFLIKFGLIVGAIVFFAMVFFPVEVQNAINIFKDLLGV